MHLFFLDMLPETNSYRLAIKDSSIFAPSTVPCSLEATYAKYFKSSSDKLYGFALATGIVLYYIII